MPMYLWLLAMLMLAACGTPPISTPVNATLYPIDSFAALPSKVADTLWATHFEYPVGPPNGKGYYNAQGFGPNNHLGDDWNGKGGGNTDLGDTVYAIANGYITKAEHLGGGWGKVMRITHYLPKNHPFAPSVESLYAHLDTMFLTAGTWVTLGTPIGTIGNADGLYYAHLHLEIREKPDLQLGRGYSADTTGYINPTWFLKSNRIN